MNSICEYHKCLLEVVLYNCLSLHLTVLEMSEIADTTKQLQNCSSMPVTAKTKDRLRGPGLKITVRFLLRNNHFLLLSEHQLSSSFSTWLVSPKLLNSRTRTSRTGAASSLCPAASVSGWEASGASGSPEQSFQTLPTLIFKPT